LIKIAHIFSYLLKFKITSNNHGNNNDNINMKHPMVNMFGTFGFNKKEIDLISR